MKGVCCGGGRGRQGLAPNMTSVGKMSSPPTDSTCMISALSTVLLLSVSMVAKICLYFSSDDAGMSDMFDRSSAAANQQTRIESKVAQGLFRDC